MKSLTMLIASNSRQLENENIKVIESDMIKESNIKLLNSISLELEVTHGKRYKKGHHPRQRL